jgi:hypothetical protein
MNPGDVLKTRFDPKTPNGLWKAYGAVGGSAITTFKASQLIGALNTIVSDKGVSYCRVLLFSPVSYKGTAYRYIFIEAAKVFTAPPDANKTYYPTSALVNVRQDPSTTSTKLGSVAKGTAIGVGNGVFVNGMARIKLARALNGWTYGWCSINYITVTAPGTTTKPTPTVPPDPKTGTTPQPNILDKPEAALDNLLGEEKADWAKWAMLGVSLLVIGLIVWQVAKPDKKIRK